MDKFEKTLLPSDSLDVDMWTWLARNFVPPSKKHPKRLSHAGIAITSGGSWLSLMVGPAKQLLKFQKVSFVDYLNLKVE